MELICFLKQLVVSPKRVGALMPSSRGLAEVLTNAAGVSDAATVVEFGPGTGVFTEMILRKLPQDARFFAIEICEEFVKSTRERCPGVQVFHDSAANVRKYLDQMGLDSCDCIVSGLPFANFEDALQEELLDAVIDVLKPGGVFATFTYFQSPHLPYGRRFRRRLTQRFSKVEETPIVWKNFPPAFAYRAEK